MSIAPASSAARWRGVRLDPLTIGGRPLYPSGGPAAPREPARCGRPRCTFLLASRIMEVAVGTIGDHDAYPRQVPHARTFHQPRGHHRGRAWPYLPRPGDGRGASDRRKALAAGADSIGAALVAREPALLQLVRPARAQGPQRLSLLRAAHGPAAVAGAIATERPRAAASPARRKPAQPGKGTVTCAAERRPRSRVPRGRRDYTRVTLTAFGPLGPSSSS